MADIHKEQELPTAPPQAQEIPDGKPPVPITPPAIKAKKKKHILTPRKQLLIKSMMKDLTNLVPLFWFFKGLIFQRLGVSSLLLVVSSNIWLW